jgi:hypothetical protein
MARIPTRWIVLFGFASALGCYGRDRAATTTTTSGSVTLANDYAAEQLASARCDREAACNNVGFGRRYDNRAACILAYQHNAREELRVDQCPYGISNGALDKCITVIEDERCNNPLDTITRLTECRQDVLCSGG